MNEVTSYYLLNWGLMGGGENADEFMLIARLCDEVIINYEEGILELGLRK